MTKTGILFFLFFLFACKEKREPFDKWRLEEATLAYKEKKLAIEFPQESITHFPNSINRLPIEIYEQLEPNRSSQFFFLIEHSIPKNTQDMIQNSIARYRANNDSLLVIEDHQIGTFTKRYRSYKDYDMGLGYYPIPFFSKKEYSSDPNFTKGMYSENTISGLSEDFIIYILNSKPEKYRGDLKPLRYMPNAWENGYSSGICVSSKNKIVIYWALVW